MWGLIEFGGLLKVEVYLIILKVNLNEIQQPRAT